MTTQDSKVIYDYIIIGGGFGGLAIGALLAKDGKKVLLLEANDAVGGHAYTLKKGKFQFCHDVQYLMGCQPGGPMHTLLTKLDLEKTVQFNKMNSKSYDIISVKNKKIEVPFGIDNYCNELCKLYPEHEVSLKEFFELEKKSFFEADGYHKVLSKTDILLRPWKYFTIIRHFNKTLDDMFNQFNFPTELRAILAGRMGNLSARPHEVSFLMYAGMDVAYSESGYFPKKGMLFLVESIKDIILQNGGKVIVNSKVISINTVDERATSVETTTGVYSANKFISNIDPQLTLHLAKEEHLPKKYLYQYSDSIFCVYLGIKGIDLSKHFLNKQNIWHHSQKDLDSEYWSVIKHDDFSHPWLFISAPSMLADPGFICPKNNHTLEILTFTNYDHFKKLYITNKKEYDKFVKKITAELIKIVEKNYIPNLSKKIAVKIVHTPIDMERVLGLPNGNVYGSRITPSNYNLNRITYTSPIKNLWFVGATASFPGIMGVTVGAMELFEKLR